MCAIKKNIFLSAISSRFYRFVFSFLRCYPQIAKCVVYQPLVSLRICPTATRCHVVTVTLSRCHIVTLSRCHAVTCIVMKLTWTMLSRINGQSWPHCQYCSHRDRAYGLKIFSVLFLFSACFKKYKILHYIYNLCFTLLFGSFSCKTIYFTKCTVQSK